MTPSIETPSDYRLLAFAGRDAFLSIARISDASGINRRTASRRICELADRGLLETGQTGPSIGRPSIGFRLTTAGKAALERYADRLETVARTLRTHSYPPSTIGAW